jgi:hypothetical protein
MHHRSGRPLALIFDQDDAEREYAYQISPLGRLEAALAEAEQRGWTVVSMNDDWRTVLAFAG